MSTVRRLPVSQLTILSLCRFAEPIAFTSVFPYLPEMIESFGVPENEIAKWAGIATAAFSISQCLTSLFWGWASDVYGRKSIILIGLTNTMVTSLLFGLSTSLPMAIFARALAGAGNGNVGIIRTMVAELCPWKELQPRAFSIMPMVWNIGAVIGPAFGGALSNPLRVDFLQPRGERFFEKYPFALPNIVAACIFMTGISIGLFFMKETLETRKYDRDVGLEIGQWMRYGLHTKWTWFRKAGNSHDTAKETDPLLDSSRVDSHSRSLRNDEHDVVRESPTVTVHPRPPTWREVFSPQSVLVIIVYTALAMLNMAYDQLLPVFMHHPREETTHLFSGSPFKFSGGFGMASQEIGILFTINGIFGVIFQFFLFPPIARAYGSLVCLKLSFSTFPIIFFITPFTILLPAGYLRQFGVVAMIITKNLCTTFSFPACTILLTNSATSLRVLGTLNGIATSVSALGRAVGPILGGVLFSAGVKRGYVGMPFWLFAVLTLLSLVPLSLLQEGKGFGDDDSREEDEGLVRDRGTEDV